MLGGIGQVATANGCGQTVCAGVTRRSLAIGAAALAAGACCGLRPMSLRVGEAFAADESTGARPRVTNDAIWDESAMTLEGEVARYQGSDDILPSSWALWAVNVPEAWKLLGDAPGAGVTVGIIDTPVYCGRTSSGDGETVLAGHEDLPFVAFSEQEDEPEAGWVETFHGTVVAGIIAALADNGSGAYGGAVGVAHGCALANVSYSSPGADDYVAGEQGGSSDDGDSNRDAALRYAYGLERLIVEAGARVINVSGGLSVEDVLRPAHDADPESEGRREAREAIDAANEIIAARLNLLLDDGYDFVICKASGNSNSTTDPDYGESGIEGGQDAALDILSGIADERLASRIIVVGATTPVLETLQQVAPYSAGGSRVDVLAPGTRIYSTSSKVFGWLAGNGLDVPIIGSVFESDEAGNGYTWGIGTSFATPIVSGVAALVWQANPSLTGSQVKEVICSTATMPAAYAWDNAQFVTAFDTDVIHNVIDAAAAVRLAFEMEGAAGAVPGLPVGVFYATGSQGGSQKSLTIDQSGLVRISEFSGAMGQETTIPYQATPDASVETPEGTRAYLLTPAGEAEVRQMGVDGIVETFPVEGCRSLLYDAEADVISLPDEPYYSWVRSE